MSKSKKEYFVSENRQGDPQEILSPSGKYKLIIERFSTGKGTWAYSQGTVYKGDEVVGQIQRNYSAFPFAWIENHPNGHDYFIGGEDYQGQTVLELDTGTRRDLLPEEAAEGFGFCWASYRYLPEHKLLIVSGCYWACPYEIRYYDFSDPMNGWPQLEIVGDEANYIEDSPKEPTIENGILTTYQIVDKDDFVERYPDVPIESVTWEKVKSYDGYDDVTVVSYKTYKIENAKLMFLKEDATEYELDYRERQRIAEEEYETWKQEFKQTDPLYLALVDGCKDPEMIPESWMSTGYTFDNWCPGYEFHESRWCKDIYKKEDCRISIEWGIKTGPVKLIIVKGKETETKFWMEHSAESMKLAFEYAKEVIRGLP